MYRQYSNAISYQYVFNLVVSLPTRRVPRVFMNVSARERRAFNKQISWCVNIYQSNTIIITILKETVISNCQFQSIPSPQFCIKNLVTEFSYGTEKNDWKPALVPHKISQFSPHTWCTYIQKPVFTLATFQNYIWHLSLINSTLVTADNILWCTKFIFPFNDFNFFSTERT